jgi:hypothetical protein
MRNVVRVLYKNSRMQSALSMFSKLPSPQSIYVIYKWLERKQSVTAFDGPISFSKIKKFEVRKSRKYRLK